MLMPRMASTTPTWLLYCRASRPMALLQYELSLQYGQSNSTKMSQQSFKACADLTAAQHGKSR